MPRQAPRFRPPGWKPSDKWASSQGRSRHERGYGSAHEAMRRQVLEEEPYCRMCIAEGVHPPRPSKVADHIRAKAEGGSSRRENYQGICWPHSKAKTAKEGALGRANSTLA